jgi:hypothetical protein
MNKALAAAPMTRPDGLDAAMEVRLVPPRASGWDWLRRMLLVHAEETRASEEGHQPSRPKKSAANQLLLRWSQPGSNRRPPACKAVDRLSEPSGIRG